MKKYSDEERIDIALREYYDYKIGENVVINKGKNRLGYVAEYKNKGTGEQTYVVTDERLGEAPTVEELANVKEVTLLYRGSTSPMEMWKNPLDFILDWGVNDVPMALKILNINPDNPPTPQLQSSAIALKASYCVFLF